MSAEAFAYPFLFVAIFFESFILVTLLSGPAKAARNRRGAGLPADTELPTVAVVVPCWNEALTVAGTCESLLALDYPHDKLEVVLVNDGSTDATPEIMQRFAGHPQVTVINKENGGKHTALNAGIAATHAEIVGCLDADSFVEPDALREIVPCFGRPEVAAVTAAMSVHEPKKVIEHMQNAEYLFGIAYRHTFASINGLYVTPGPFSFYRREIVEHLGGFRHGHQTEDMEMALRIQQAGYHIENTPHARVYTKVPTTVGGLVKQRTRWTAGFLRNILGEYRGLVGAKKRGVLGLLVLPSAIISVGSGILLFLLMIGTFGHSIITTLQVRAGIPFSYAYLPQLPTSFDWFYLPTSLFSILSIGTLVAAFAFILVGRHISRTRSKIVVGLISYAFLYGLISPLWLFRATADVGLGKSRGWRW